MPAVADCDQLFWKVPLDNFCCPSSQVFSAVHAVKRLLQPNRNLSQVSYTNLSAFRNAVCFKKIYSEMRLFIFPTQPYLLALKIKIGKSLTIVCNRPLAHTARNQYVVNPVDGAWISIQPFLCAGVCLALIYDSS